MLYEDNLYLVHYGIKGQRWGVRRFQNLDGTLTQEGKERYYKHLESDERHNKEREAKAPEELKFHMENKDMLIKKAQENGYTEPMAKAWHDARKKALESEIENIPKDRVFAKEMRKSLENNSNISIAELKEIISKNAKKAKLDSKWVENYYEQNLDNIIRSYDRHGETLGQNWGIRRFQNKDGSLNDEGKNRYYGKQESTNFNMPKYSKDDEKIFKKSYSESELKQKRDQMIEILENNSDIAFMEATNKSKLSDFSINGKPLKSYPYDEQCYYLYMMYLSSQD